MFSHIITFKRLFFWPFGKVKNASFQKSSLFTAYQIYTNASKSGIKNDQLKECFVQVNLAWPVTICRSFTLRPAEPRTPSRTRRVGTGAPSPARHGARDGPRSAAVPPPRRPQARRGPHRHRAGPRAPNHLPCGVKSPPELRRGSSGAPPPRP